MWKRLDSRRIKLLHNTFRYKLLEKEVEGFIVRRLDVLRENDGSNILISHLNLGYENMAERPCVAIPSTLNPKEYSPTEIFLDCFDLFNRLYLQPQLSISHPNSFEIEEGVFRKEGDGICLFDNSEEILRILTSKLITYIFKFCARIEIKEGEFVENIKGVGIYQIEYSYDVPLNRTFVPFPNKSSIRMFRELL